MVRLKDIAARAGVSVMTVSKVLRGAPDISAPTKNRIQQLAQQMGYVPDSMAQGLRTRTTRLFGLVIPALTHPIYARVVMAIEELAHQMGYDIVLAHTLNDPEREEAIIRRLLSRRVDGLFLTPVYRLEAEASIYQELSRRQTPVVLLGPAAPFCSPFLNVEPEDAAGSQRATAHLLELGHRRIAYLTGPAASPASRERLDGYKRALREAQIDMDDSLIFPAGTTIEEGANAARQILRESPRMTALQTHNDLVAIGAASVFLEHGRRIPEDLSVAGFGNILTSEHFRTPLTTVRQPKARLGRAAMELMQGILKNESPVAQRLEASLVIRQSTAPVPEG